MKQAQDLAIKRLGDCTVPSPMRGVRFAKDDEHVLLHSDLNEIKKHLDNGIEPPRFELAGPREKIFFDPATLSCGIVTCGGLCPGLVDNEVNFCLIPEVPFTLDGFLSALKQRLERRGHAVIVVAEGAGRSFSRRRVNGTPPATSNTATSGYCSVTASRSILKRPAWRSASSI